MIGRIKYYLFLALSVLCPLAYDPSLTNDAKDAASQGVLQKPILILTFLLFVASFKSRCLKNRLIAAYGAFLLLTICMFVFISGVISVNESHMQSEIMTLLIPIVALIIGYNNNYSSREIKTAASLFILTSVFVALRQIVINLGGFIIYDEYLSFAKNSFGAMLSLGAIMATYLSFDTSKKWERIFWYSVIILVLVLIITIRARTAFLGALVLGAYVIYHQQRRFFSASKTLSLLVLLVMVISLKYIYTGTLITEGIDDYFYNGFFQSREDDVTTGRMERNVVALDIISQSLLWGRLTYWSDVHQVHNYLLRVMSDYGILGSIGILGIYLWTLIFVIRNSIRYKSGLKFMGFTCMLIPFWISLAEPTFPFGPGTTIFLAYVLLGTALANKDAITKRI